MRRRRTGRLLHDPAWHDPDLSRGRPASGNRPTRVHGDYRRQQGRVEPAAGPAKPRGGATKRPVRIQHPTSWPRSRHRRYQPQIEIPIASDCGPRVPSSGTFVRLPAPETLHGGGHRFVVEGCGCFAPSFLPFSQPRRRPKSCHEGKRRSCVSSRKPAFPPAAEKCAERS
jgi:hypothetical protein